MGGTLPPSTTKKVSKVAKTLFDKTKKTKKSDTANLPEWGSEHQTLQDQLRKDRGGQVSQRDKENYYQKRGDIVNENLSEEAIANLNKTRAKAAERAHSTLKESGYSDNDIADGIAKISRRISQGVIKTSLTSEEVLVRIHQGRKAGKTQQQIMEEISGGRKPGAEAPATPAAAPAAVTPAKPVKPTAKPEPVKAEAPKPVKPAAKAKKPPKKPAVKKVEKELAAKPPEEFAADVVDFDSFKKRQNVVAADRKESNDRILKGMGKEPVEPRDKRAGRRAQLEKQRGKSSAKVLEFKRKDKQDFVDQVAKSKNKSEKFDLNPEEQEKLLVQDLTKLNYMKAIDSKGKALQRFGLGKEDISKALDDDLAEAGVDNPAARAKLLAALGLGAGAAATGMALMDDEEPPVDDGFDDILPTPGGVGDEGEEDPDFGKEAVDLMDQFVKVKQPNFQAPPAAKDINTEEDLQTAIGAWKSELVNLQNEYRTTKEKIARRRKWEQLVQGFAQIAAGLYALKSGIPIGKIDFDRTDWGAEYDRAHKDFMTGIGTEREGFAMTSRAIEARRRDWEAAEAAKHRGFMQNTQLQNSLVQTAQANNSVTKAIMDLGLRGRELGLKYNEKQAKALAAAGGDPKEYRMLINQYSEAASKAINSEIGDDDRRAKVAKMMLVGKQLQEQSGTALPQYFYPRDASNISDVRDIMKMQTAWENLSKKGINVINSKTGSGYGPFDLEGRKLFHQHFTSMDRQAQFQAMQKELRTTFGE